MSTICLTNCKLFLKEKFDEKTQRSHCIFKARDGNHYKKQEAKSDRIKIQILRLVAEKVQWERVANLPVMMFPNFHYYFSVFVFSATKRRDKLEKRKEGGSEATRKPSQNKEELAPCPPFRSLVQWNYLSTLWKETCPPCKIGRTLRRFANIA